MKVYVPKESEVSNYEKLGYTILSVEPWNELKDFLKASTYDSWCMLTVAKDL